MALILGIETSCDETAAAVFDTARQQVLSNAIFSQNTLHEKYGGVVPEIASRSHLEKISVIVEDALRSAQVPIDQIDHIAVTNKPGLIGSLLIGFSFAKGLAWAENKKIITVDHIAGHIYSSFLSADGVVRTDIPFPHLCLVVSGGHTAIFLVNDFESYQLIGQTHDDAAGEAFDKVSKLIGLGYPGGPRVEKMAQAAGFKDFFNYPRTKDKNKTLEFSFSGLKTAVLYDLVKRGAYDLKTGIIAHAMTDELRQQVSSSMLVCVGDIMKAKINLALLRHPEVRAVTFVGGVACNSYLRNQLHHFCVTQGRQFFAPPVQFCGDNAAMISFVGSKKAEKNQFADLSVDVGD